MPNYRYDIEQGTTEWLQCRLGKFTASDFHVFLGKSQTKTDKLWKIIAERVFQDSDEEPFSTYAMERGKILEVEARKLYSILTEQEVKEVGFVEATEPEFAGFVGVSPDGLVDDDGLIEVKSPLGKNVLQWTKLNDDGVREVNYIKPEYVTQVQMQLLITERKWCDFIYYHPRLGCIIKRIEPDEEIQNKIREALTECIAFVKNETKE